VCSPILAPTAAHMLPLQTAAVLLTTAWVPSAHVIRPSPTAPLVAHSARSVPAQPRTGSGALMKASSKIDKWAEEEGIGPFIRMGARKDKVINWYGGIVFALPALVFGVFWYGAMSLVGAVCDKTGLDPKRKIYDNLGRIWNFCVLRTTGNYPRVISGLENRPKEGQAALICANHASWYDILLAGYTLPATFKFVSAAELAELPGVGKQLYGGKHVLIDRTSRRGQLRAVKDSMEWLRQGVSVFAFPEGTRSRDGRLQRFKGGVFAMAVKTGVPVLPVTIVNAFKPYPPNALLPIKLASDMEMHFHPMIESEGKTEAEIQELCEAAIKSKLGPDQLPKEKPTTEPAPATA